MTLPSSPSQTEEQAQAAFMAKVRADEARGREELDAQWRAHDKEIARKRERDAFAESSMAAYNEKRDRELVRAAEDRAYAARELAKKRMLDATVRGPVAGPGSARPYSGWSNWATPAMTGAAGAGIGNLVGRLFESNSRNVTTEEHARQKRNRLLWTLGGAGLGVAGGTQWDFGKETLTGLLSKARRLMGGTP